MYKIAHLTTVHPRFDTRIFWKECRSLAAAGHLVTLIVADGNGYELRDKVTILDIGTSSTNRWLKIGFLWLRMLRQLTLVKADIYHFHDPELIPIGILLKLAGKKVIYDAHEDVALDIQTKVWIKPSMRYLIGKFFDVFEKTSSKFFDAVITVAPNLLKKFARVNSSSFEVRNFPMIEDLSFAKTANYERKKNQLLYVGSLTKVRGASKMLDALLHLDANLVLAGTFSPPSLLEECQKHPAWSKVKYLGFCSREQIIALCQESALGYALIQEDKNLMTGYPVKLFEYMSCELPVIVSDFPLWREIVEGAQCGLAINQYEVANIVAATEKILSDADLRNKMGQNGKEAVLKKYNWPQEEQHLLNVYEQILEKKHDARSASKVSEIEANH